MKTAEIITEAQKGPLVVGTYIGGKPDQMTLKGDGKILHFERAFVLVDGEPREYGRLLERVEQFNEHKLKAGDRCVVRLTLRPDSKNPRAWRLSGVVEPLAA
jgi:hypothetical protein